MPAPTPAPTYLYKILPTAPPSPLPTTLPLSPLDLNDGYIHLSTSTQVPSTCAAYFTSATTLWLLKINHSTLAAGTDEHGVVGKGELKWEEVGRGCFAHFYGAGIGSGNVEGVVKVERGEGKTWEGVLRELEW